MDTWEHKAKITFKYPYKIRRLSHVPIHILHSYEKK